MPLKHQKTLISNPLSLCFVLGIHGVESGYFGNLFAINFWYAGAMLIITSAYVMPHWYL